MPRKPPVHNAQRTTVNRKESQREYNRTKRTGEKFYKTSSWKRLRAVFARQNPLCVRCKESGIVRPVEIVDHVTPIKQGGAPLAWENLQSLCRSCHNQKTAGEG